MAVVLASTRSPFYIVFLVITISMSFIGLLIKHPFDADRIAHDIDDVEAIILVQSNSTRLSHPDYKPSTNTSSPTHASLQQNHAPHVVTEDMFPFTADDIILGDPLRNRQCQNAIVDRDHIDRSAFIAAYYNDTLYEKCKLKRIWQPGVWSREYIDAISRQNCFSPRLMLRTQKSDMLPNTTAPVFYHIPKSASSSTASMTTDYFGFGSRWRTRYEMMHEPYTNTVCGFTFVRDPVRRIISAYYTVNAMIFQENGFRFANHSNPKYEAYEFIRVHGEPQRFHRFMDDMIANPSLFYSNVPLRHCSTQTYFLSTFYGSAIHWIGRVEQFDQHWLALLNHGECGKWFRNDSHIVWRGNKKQIERATQGMYHYGYDASFYTFWKNQKIFEEYVTAMDLQTTFDKRHKLPPVYHRMTEEIYNKITHFFYQDFVCFGYDYDYTKFIEFVKLKEIHA